MKKLIMLAALLLLCLAGQTQTAKLKDGFYEVYKYVYDTTKHKEPVNGTQAIGFNSNFKEDAPKNCSRIIVYTGEFVQLELEKIPELGKKKGSNSWLNISMTPEAAGKLKGFTEKRIMKQVAIVMDGEVLTVQKIRAAITDGKLEISRSNDNACEKLQVMLQRNVKQ